MPAHYSTADRISIVSDGLNVPRKIIQEAIDSDIITTVGYAGLIVIDAVDALRVAQQYHTSLITKEYTT